MENKDIPMLVGKEKGVVRAPTPEPPPPGQKVTPAPKRKNSMSDKKKKSPPSKYEPLALSYANRSAALRRYGRKMIFLLYRTLFLDLNLALSDACF